MIKKIEIFLIKSYQLIAKNTKTTTCKYYPSCSNYMLKAIELHGAFKGTALGINRIFRCNRFSKGGYDPVPLPKNKKYNLLELG